MRRVLLIGDYPPPYGGISVQIAALRHRLGARSDTEVRVLDIGARRRQRRAECLAAPHAPGFAATTLRHVRRGFIAHLHTNGHNVKSWILTLVCAGAGVANGRRSLVSLGSGTMPDFLATARPWIRAVARLALAAAGGVIVRNERARAWLVEFGVSADKIVVLPGFYGVSADEIGHLPHAVSRFRRHHRPLIGAVASSGPVYGIPLLLDAAARLRGRHPRLGVVLVGPDELADGCPRWALPIGERGRPTLLAVMQALDVFVRPTYFDGDASSVREALALGVRVVASDTDFRPEGVWRFPCGDADALAATIEAALATPAARIESTALPALLSIYDRVPLDGQAVVTAAAAPDPVRPGPAGRLELG
jgi:glycogen(starch) synthase